MTRSIPLALSVAAITAGTASAAVSASDHVVKWRGYPIRVALVGGIDASPCSDPDGCVRGIVELRYRGLRRDHLVRCGHPRRLHVMGTLREHHHRHVVVWACGQGYDWRLPR